MKIIIYKQSNGEIQRCCDVPWAVVPAQLQAGETYILGYANDAEEYVVNYTVVPRPDMPISINGLEQLVGGVLRIDGIPQGATLHCPVGTVAIDDGFIEWTSLVEGMFPITIDCFPYKQVFMYASFTNP